MRVCDASTRISAEFGGIRDLSRHLSLNFKRNKWDVVVPHFKLLPRRKWGMLERERAILTCNQLIISRLLTSLTTTCYRVILDFPLSVILVAWLWHCERVRLHASTWWLSVFRTSYLQYQMCLNQRWDSVPLDVPLHIPKGTAASPKIPTCFYIVI